MSDFGERDISFETLAQACSIDIEQLTRDARGQLNAALKQLREASPDLDDLELALVIEDKAKTYRAVMPDVILTPSALAKHWAALDGMREQRRPAYPQHEPQGCPTCNDLRLIEATGQWPGYDPCPDCNAKAIPIAREWRARFERMHGHTPPRPREEDLQKLGETVGALRRQHPSPLIPSDSS